MSTDPNTPAELKIAMASSEVYCERWPDEGHSWSYTHHAGQPRIETRQCYSCGYVSVEPVREKIANMAAENARLRQQRNEARDGVRDLSARYERLVDERDAIRRRLLLVDLADETGPLDELLGKIAYERHEAREQRDALVAEAERILTDHFLFSLNCDHENKTDTPWCGCAGVDLGTHSSVGAAVRAWVAHVMGVLREAIAKTAPQPPASSPESPKDELAALHAGLVSRQLLPAGSQANVVASALWLIDDRIRTVLGLAEEREELRAERDAAVKARDENWTECNRLRRDLAEARGETERVRRDYRAYNQRLRDSIGDVQYGRVIDNGLIVATALDNWTHHRYVGQWIEGPPDTAQAAAGTTRDNNGGGE